MPNLCVYAASSRHLPAQYYAEAGAIGDRLGGLGWHLVFGGANIGLMDAVARGIKRQGRKVLSVIPRIFDHQGLTFAESDAVILTEDLRHRKRIMEAHADAFLTLPGGPGTLDEFFETLTLRQLGLVQKPIVLFNFDHHFDGTLLQLRRMVDVGFAHEEIFQAFTVARTIEEIVVALNGVEARAPRIEDASTYERGD